MTEKARTLYQLEDYEILPVPGHEGGRNLVYICSRDGENRYVLRTSALDDRTEAKLLENISKMRDKTCIIVTHRAAALSICDYTLHIEEGTMSQKA